MRGKEGVVLGMVLALSTAIGALPGYAQPVDTARIAADSPNDWLT